MRNRLAHVLFALGLALSVLAGTIVTGSAQPSSDGPNQVYLPWVPNMSEIEDPRGFDPTGPYHGSVTVQNLEDGEISVEWEVTATGASGSVNLDGLATVTLTGDFLFAATDVEGSGVVLTGQDGARIAAVQKQAAPEAPTNEARTGEDHSIVAGYTGLTGDQIGSELVVPIVQTNNNWNTLVRLTNFGNSSAWIELTLHEAGGVSAPEAFELNVAAGATETFDLLENDVADGWTGSARISADQDIAAVAERVKNETNMLIMNTSMPGDDGATQYAPLLLREWNHWNTGISIANLADVANEVTITYYARDGVLLDTEIETIPANGMDFVYMPATVLDNGETALDGVVGSALITAEHPFRGAVDEVKYFGDGPDTGHAMSYMIEESAASAGETLAMPIFQSGMDDGMGDTTGIQMFNPTDEWVAGAVRFITQHGVEYRDPLIVHLEPGEGYTVYPYDIPDFPPGVHGSALVQVYAGDGAITAAANNVNYEVANDGSASFNLMRTGEAGPDTPGHILRSDPRWATNEWETPFSLTATLMDLDGNPIQGEDILIMANPSIQGPPGEAQLIETNADGQAVFNGEFSRGGSEFVDRFIIIYPGYDPADAPPDEIRIETYSWKTWVAPGPEPDASIDLALFDEAGNPLAAGDTVTTGDDVTATATVILDGEPLADQEVTFIWGYSDGPGHFGHLETWHSYTGTDGEARHTLEVGDSPNISVLVETTIDGWVLEDSLDGFLEVE